jgi:hypothetical protein
MPEVTIETENGGARRELNKKWKCQLVVKMETQKSPVLNNPPFLKLKYVVIIGVSFHGSIYIYHFEFVS